MKKNKGFTLIELLAIIVILALIAVIISPIILGIIEDSKLSAATDSAYGYKEAIGKYYASQLSQNSDFMLNGEYTIGTDGSISDEENTYDIAVTGTIPNSGYVTIEKGTVTAGCIQINEFAVRLENKKVTSTEKGYCIEPPVIVEEFPTVTDSNPGIICGNGTTEDYDNSTVCYIYSVEDLVAFSNMVNSGKTFENKTVMLMNGLDIKEDKSYANASANQFGDLNENSTTSTALKEELTDTTAKGFKPIGDNTNQFLGTFEGNTKTIKNIFINRSSTDYVGLFGYNAGTIKGLKVTNADIKGQYRVGVIAGQNSGTITSVIADGNASGYKNVAVLAGLNDNGTIEGITSGNVSTSITDGGANVAGIIGYQSGGTITGIYKSGSITKADSYGNCVGRTVASTDYNNKGTRTAGALSTITINGSTKTSADVTSENGYDIPSTGINNIAMLDNFVDTYLNGDNNNDGYYYDYDANGEFTVYKLSDRPLNITLSGQGTEQSPYRINNYNDLKQVGYKLGENGNGIYYSLNSDIDLTNQNPIILGNEKYHFTGVFEGNAHTISNINLIGIDNVGLFGYNDGTIKGLKVVNGNNVGNYRVGIIAGTNIGTITSVIANGNASGYKNVAVLAGYNDNGTIEGITSGNVSTSITDGGANVAGIVGYQSGGTITGIYKSGIITKADNYSNCVGRTVATINTSNKGTRTAGALSTITINGSTKTSADVTSVNGYDIPSTGINNIAMVDNFVDTYLNGDNNNDGYYYDYDSNGEFTVYKLSDRPLNITLSGQGTEQSPYIINNYNDLKQVGYKLGTNGEGKYYKLNADIDLTNQNPIILGNEKYHFTGIFDGNAHTISNINLIGVDNVSFFGYNDGTIKGLTLVNGNMTGKNRTGVIVGTNTGNITSVIANGNISGYKHAGIVAGRNEGGTIEAVVSGNVSTSITDGGAVAGGISGYHETGTIKGIFIAGSITKADPYSNRYGRTIGDISSGTRSTGALNTILVAGNTKTSTDKTSAHGKDYTAEQLQTLTPYQEVGLNTSTTGEYRYALDSNYNPYIVKN